MRRKIMAVIIPLAALCLFAPITEAKASDTDTTITDNNGAYTVTIPANVSIDSDSKSAELTVSAELQPYNELTISINSDNEYHLKYNDDYRLPYTLMDDKEEKINEITYSTKETTDTSNQIFSTVLKAELSDDAVTKVSGTYEDTLSFNIACTKYYRVTLNLNADDAILNQTYVMVPAGSTYGDLPIPTRDGWHFEGWYTDAEHNSGSKEIKVDESKTVTDNTTIYAHWYYNWTVKYDANGGSGSMDNTLHGWYTGKHVSLNTFKRDGYQFAGWYMSRDNAGKTEWSYGDEKDKWINLDSWYTEDAPEIAEKKLSKYVLPDGNVLQGCTNIHDDVITLHAIWKPNTYTVKYDNNSSIDSSASGTMDDSVMTYDGEETLSKCTFINSNSDAKFIGWNTKPDGTGIAYTDGQITPNLTSDANGSVTLYAQWGYDNTVKVEFEDVNGDFQTADIRTITECLPAGKEMSWKVGDLTEYKGNAETWQHQWKTADDYSPVKYTTENKAQETIIKIYRQVYYLDLNAHWYDSDGSTTTQGAGNLIWNGITTATAQVEINGKLQTLSNGGTDYFAQHRYGSTFKFTITMKSGYEFKGVEPDSVQPLRNLKVEQNVITGIVTGERHVDNSNGTIGPYDATTIALKIQKVADDSTTTTASEE